VRGGLKGKQPGGGLRKVNWDLRSLEPLRKDFYIEHLAVRNRYRNRISIISNIKFIIK